MKITTEAWLNALTNELQNNILGFWIKHTLDEEHGGFVGEIDNQLNVIAGAEKSLVLNARILWTFATAYRTYGSAEYLSMAERAYRYLLEHFLDKEYGGLYWMVDASVSLPSLRSRCTARLLPSMRWLNTIMLPEIRMRLSLL